MPRTLQLAVIAVACVFAAGCFPLSLSPLYTGDADVVFDQALVGQWMNEEQKEHENERWELMPIEGENAYVVRRLGEPAVQFRGVLVQVGQRRFLDLIATGHEPEIDPAFLIHNVPAHSIWRVTIEPERLRFALPDIGAVTALLKAQPDLIAHLPYAIEAGAETDGILITADAAAFQTFVRDHLPDEFFKNEIVLVPIPAPQPAP